MDAIKRFEVDRAGRVFAHMASGGHLSNQSVECLLLFAILSELRELRDALKSPTP